MRSGLSTKIVSSLRHCRRSMKAALIVSSALILLSGCERKTANNVPNAPAALLQENAAPDQRSKDAKADMVLIAGGKFIMGDKEQVDATPHEVVVSAFLMDRHLVIQERYAKAM